MNRTNSDWFTLSEDILNKTMLLSKNTAFDKVAKDPDNVIKRRDLRETRRKEPRRAVKESKVRTNCEIGDRQDMRQERSIDDHDEVVPFSRTPFMPRYSIDGNDTR